jgi:ATP-dependent 26S proteasome regulatory subunit
MDADVDLERLAADTADCSGAEIESLCSNAGRNALVRVLETREQPSVRGLDFAKALQERKKIKGQDVRRPMGFGRS